MRKGFAGPELIHQHDRILWLLWSLSNNGRRHQAGESIEASGLDTKGLEWHTQGDV
jgi:hypothetical protein